MKHRMDNYTDVFLSDRRVNILREWTIEQTIQKFLNWMVMQPYYGQELKALKRGIIKDEDDDDENEN